MTIKTCNSIELAEGLYKITGQSTVNMPVYIQCGFNFYEIRNIVRHDDAIVLNVGEVDNRYNLPIIPDDFAA